MEKLQLIARFAVHPGKLESFNTVMTTCIERVREKEPGNLQYDWFYNADASVYKVCETYANPDAVFAHMENVGPYLGQLLALSDFSGEIYGNPPEALIKALADFEVSYYAFAAGT
ncbi:putative quinol monooxygenase [Robiginitalea sp. SC105]|uniref:putative quinol monooxygenase n=1 Tax=Robiginitalea sp. SC105 TaxID=2762332 RepID=UPI00163A7F1E|nr:antibiotic biosynthesis monooxygenase [Robiginitalea sp. SC105]MBC2838747.1 antibiotic biosynthesis monooxygenase [Robiginitalea sp. SC105]